jgi:hypothetical protein
MRAREANYARARDGVTVYGAGDGPTRAQNQYVPPQMMPNAQQPRQYSLPPASTLKNGQVVTPPGRSVGTFGALPSMPQEPILQQDVRNMATGGQVPTSFEQKMHHLETGTPNPQSMYIDGLGTFARSMLPRRYAQDPALYPSNESPEIAAKRDVANAVRQFNEMTKATQWDNEGVMFKDGDTTVTYFDPSKHDQSLGLPGDPEELEIASLQEASKVYPNVAVNLNTRRAAENPAVTGMTNATQDAFNNMLRNMGPEAVNSLGAVVQSKNEIRTVPATGISLGRNESRGAVPDAFRALLMRKMREHQTDNAYKPPVRHHPSESNYMSPDGQFGMNVRKIQFALALDNPDAQKIVLDCWTAFRNAIISGMNSHPSRSMQEHINVARNALTATYSVVMGQDVRDVYAAMEVYVWDRVRAPWQAPVSFGNPGTLEAMVKSTVDANWTNFDLSALQTTTDTDPVVTTAPMVPVEAGVPTEHVIIDGLTYSELAQVVMLYVNTAKELIARAAESMVVPDPVDLNNQVKAALQGQKVNGKWISSSLLRVGSYFINYARAGGPVTWGGTNEGLLTIKNLMDQALAGVAVSPEVAATPIQTPAQDTITHVPADSGTVDQYDYQPPTHIVDEPSSLPPVTAPEHDYPVNPVVWNGFTELEIREGITRYIAGIQEILGAAMASGQIPPPFQLNDMVKSLDMVKQPIGGKGVGSLMINIGQYFLKYADAGGPAPFNLYHGQLALIIKTAMDARLAQLQLFAAPITSQGAGTPDIDFWEDPSAHQSQQETPSDTPLTTTSDSGQMEVIEQNGSSTTITTDIPDDQGTILTVSDGVTNQQEVDVPQTEVLDFDIAAMVPKPEELKKYFPVAGAAIAMIIGLAFLKK